MSRAAVRASYKISYTHILDIRLYLTNSVKAPSLFLF